MTVDNGLNFYYHWISDVNIMPKLEYQEPKVTSKKVKINFFLAQTTILDQFNIIGDVYGQSGGCSWSSTSTNDCGSSSSPCTTGTCG